MFFKNFAHSLLRPRGLIIFLAAFLLMSFLQFNPNNPYLSEYDSYYHVKMAEIIKTQGIIHEFPWMQYTILKDDFVDHHFLFHVLLIPFTLIFNPIFGAKLFEVLIVALAFLFFYLILKENKVPGAFWWSLLAVFTMSSDFYYRMNFVRDMGLSLFFMLLGIYLTFKNKPLALGIVSFLYVWSYNTFMFLPFFVFLYIVSQFFSGEKTESKLFWYSLGGMLAGIILNPYFPGNVEFLITHLFATGFGAKSYTGGEWRPYDTWFWLQINFIPIFFFLGAIVFTFFKHLKQTAKSAALFLTALLFLFLVWKSKRFVEYSPLFLELSAFTLLAPLFLTLFQEAKEFFLAGKLEPRKQKEFFWTGLIFLFLIYFSWLFAFGPWDRLGKNVPFCRALYEDETPGFSQICRAYNDTQTLFSMSALKKAHEYLQEHSAEGDIVFTDDWDVFPRYFFLNSKNYYLVGLDPEFMNQYDSKLYEEWADISSGRDGTNLERIKNDFKAKWIIVNTDHEQLRENLRKHPDLFVEEFFGKNDAGVDHYPSARGDGYYIFRVL